jgi:pilus assembly protein CpaE
MSEALRACLFDPDAHSAAPLNAELSGADIEWVGVFADWQELQTCLTAHQPGVAIVNLDDEHGQQDLALVQRIIEVAPTIKILGIGRSTEPQAIIGAMRAGCSQFVRRPVDVEDLREALARIRATLQASHPESHRFCVIGAGGGAGATTVACNLALAMARLTDAPSGLVDLHLEFGDIASAFDSRPQYSLADACRDGIVADRGLLQTILQEMDGRVFLLGRPERIEEAREVTPEGVEQVLRLLSRMYQYVVVDVPRTGHLYAGAALNGADRALIVTQLSVQYLRNATRVFEGLLSAGVEPGSIEIVLNRYSPDSQIQPDEVAAHFGRPILAKIPNDYRRVVASHDLGQPILASPRSPVCREIENMAAKLSGPVRAPHMPEQPPAEPKRGLLGKLFR